MELTYSTLASPDWTLSQILHAAVAAGIAGVDFRGIGPELDITRLQAFNADLPETLKMLEAKHLSMPCLNTSIALMTPDPAKWAGMIDEARRYAALASQTGTRFLRVFGGGIPAGMEREDARKIACDHLAQLIAICKPNGCKPLVETHDSWILSDHVMQLVGGFDPAETGVLWDLEHPWRNGEWPMETAKNLTNRIEHVHIKDTARQDGKLIPTLLGQGEIPLRECLSALTGIHYTGWICLETEKRWHPEGPNPEQSIPQFAQYMRANS
jgi:sugar phosphate isomerase/epimerase